MKEFLLESVFFLGSVTGEQNTLAVLALNLSESTCHIKIRNSPFKLTFPYLISKVLGMTIANEVHELTATGRVMACQKCLIIILS